MLKTLRFCRIIYFLPLVLCWSSFVGAETLTIVGTGDGTHVLRALATVYAQRTADLTIEVPASVGSSGGIKLVGDKKYVLGRVAREIQENEKHHELNYVPYARIPVTFYVNPGVDVDQLSVEQILGIYRGDIHDWKQVNGVPGKIRVIRREHGDSSMEILNKKIPSFKDIEFTEFIKVATSESQSVALVASVPGGIGFGPIPGKSGPKVKILSLGGKNPTDAGYPLELTLGLIFHEINRTGQIEDFIRFAVSAEAKEVIRNSQALPY